MKKLLIAAVAALLVCGPATAHTIAPPVAHPAKKLPTQGTYYSCQPYWALAACEQDDLDAHNLGLQVGINFIGLYATVENLEALLAYDASIGYTQIFNVKDELADGLNGTALVSHYSPFASEVGATNNQQFLAALSAVCKLSTACGGYYTYDEPGGPCSMGYCHGSLSKSEIANVAPLQQYLTSIDPKHTAFGFNTAGGVPASCSDGPGGWDGPCARQQEANLFNWLIRPASPITGYDYYPIGDGCQGTVCEKIDDIGAIGRILQNVIAHSSYPAEQVGFVVQGFSWGDYRSDKLYPWPTADQMRRMRNQAIIGGAKLVFWYSLDDAECRVPKPPGPPNCNVARNLARWQTAINAPL